MTYTSRVINYIRYFTAMQVGARLRFRLDCYMLHQFSVNCDSNGPTNVTSNYFLGIFFIFIILNHLNKFFEANK